MRRPALCLLALGAAACGGEQAAVAPVERSDDATMQVVTLTEWPRIVEGYRTRVLVVDLWASWCTSCIERFPAMVALSKKYSRAQFISLNLDDPEDREALQWSQDFLDRTEAGFPHYHLRENLMKSFEALDLLGIPVVLIYDETGAERYRLTGDDPNRQFDESDVEAAIVALLEA